jgi:MFS family permease
LVFPSTTPICHISKLRKAKASVTDPRTVRTCIPQVIPSYKLIRTVTYRNSLIIAVLGVPGAILGGLLVEIPRFGRRGAFSIFTVLTGVFLYLTTIAKTSTELLGYNCGYNFCSNIMYAVLYAYTPEIFPTKDRGTGNALTATTNRIFGIMAASSSFLI